MTPLNMIGLGMLIAPLSVPAVLVSCEARGIKGFRRIVVTIAAVAIIVGWVLLAWSLLFEGGLE